MRETEHGAATGSVGPAAHEREARTPRLILDASRLEENVAAMAAAARSAGTALRPHVKTHKCAEIMRMQLAAGARGITVATVREAEAMVAAGADDVLIAYPPVGDWRLAAIARLADRARIIVACSAPEHVRALAELDRGIEYYWEVDCGVRRLGTEPGEPTAAAIATVAGDRRARLAGIMTFAGHAYATTSTDELAAVAAAERAALDETVRALAARGIEPGELSVGTTPLSRADVNGGGAGGVAPTEARYGNYVFYDATQVALGTVGEDRCALTVEATVVAQPADDRLILDAGSKALAAERMAAVTPGFGIVRGAPNVTIAQLYEEHAICLVEGATALKPGDRVEVIPNHACTCANLHSAYNVRGGAHDGERWPLIARGWEDVA